MRIDNNLSDQLDILANGNKIARKWSKEILGNRRRAIFHQVLKDPNKATRLKVKSDEMMKIAAIPELEKQVIRQTWDVTSLLWNQYKRLVYALTRRFAMRLGVENKLISDLIGEATIAFMKALRGYDNRDYQFSTYLGRAIKTDLRRYMARNRGLTSANEGLMISYQAKWQELVSSGKPHSFDDVCIALELSEKLRKRLWCTLQEPANEGDLAEPLSKVVIDKRSGVVDSDLIRAIGMVELSILERDAWISGEKVKTLFPTARANIREVAKEHGVTPQAAAYAAVRANKKIAAQLRSVWAS